MKTRMNLIALLYLLSVSVLIAQDDNLKGELKIEKNAKIELNTANRLYEKINNVQPVKPQKPLEYQAQDVELLLPKLDTKVKVVTTKIPDLVKLYGNYVKIGFGNYTTPYLEAFLNNKRSEKYAYGFHARHFSSKNGSVKNAGLSENNVSLYGSYFGKNTILTARAAYDRFRYNYYGYNQFIQPNAERDTLRQIYHIISANVALTNKNKNNNLNYATDLGYYRLSTFRGAREEEVLWGLTSSYKIDNTKRILADAALSISKRTDSSSIGRTWLSVKPAFEYTPNDKLTVIGGVNVAYANDTIKNYPTVHVYPRIHAEYKLLASKVVAFGGLDGDLQKTTLRTFIKENPYLGSDVVLQHTNKTLDFYMGVKGALKGGVTYRIKASTANYRYLYFFNNGVQDTSRFTILYDKNTVNVLTLNGELGYELSRRMRLALAAAYYQYNMGVVSKPWHKPSTSLSVLATYNLNQKVYFNADFYYIGGLRGKNFVSGEEVSLKGIADLNLKIDYLFSKSFSAFVEVNNIFSQKYQYYLYYQVKGINILAGLTYSF